MDIGIDPRRYEMPTFGVRVPMQHCPQRHRFCRRKTSAFQLDWGTIWYTLPHDRRQLRENSIREGSELMLVGNLPRIHLVYPFAVVPFSPSIFRGDF